MADKDYYEALGRFVDAKEKAEKLNIERAGKAKEIIAGLTTITDTATAIYKFNPETIEKLCEELRELDTQLKEAIGMANRYSPQCQKRAIEMRIPPEWIPKKA